MARSTGEDARQRSDIDDLRALGRVVEDLLIRAIREETRERVHDRQESFERRAARLDTMSCSAMPHSTKRSGNSVSNGSSPVSSARSASKATICGLRRAWSTSARE